MTRWLLFFVGLVAGVALAVDPVKTLYTDYAKADGARMNTAQRIHFLKAHAQQLEPGLLADWVHAEQFLDDLIHGLADSEGRPLFIEYDLVTGSAGDRLSDFRVLPNGVVDFQTTSMRGSPMRLKVQPVVRDGCISDLRYVGSTLTLRQELKRVLNAARDWDEKSRAVTAIAWSAEGLASGTGKGEVNLWKEGKAQALPSHRYPIRGLYWQGGQLVSLAVDGTLKSPDGRSGSTGTFSTVVRGGPRLAVVGDREIKVVALDSFQTVARIKNDDPGAGVALDPTGAWLSVLVGPNVILYDASSGQRVRKIELNDEPKQQAFTPQGTLLVLCGALLREFSLQGAPVREYGYEPSESFVLGPEGGSLLLRQLDPTLTRVYADRLLTKPSSTVTASVDGILSRGRLLAFPRLLSADGARLQTVGEAGQVWALNPAATELAVGQKDGTVRVVPVDP